MLNLFGRSAAERAKSIAICLLLGLCTLSLWQVSTENANASREDQNRRASIDVARRFAVALTTYDYVHPDIQRLQVAAVSSSSVRDRIEAASSDIVSARVSSLGEATSAVVLRLSSWQTEVLVATSQVASGSYLGSPTELVGLLSVTVVRSGTAWVVTDYRWLQAPGGAP
jgi:hypothetical protein